jgi:glutathione S-transferase
MKIYGHPWSTNTRKALMTFAEKDLHPELVLLMIPAGEHKTPAHLARHPFGKVPVLEDDGFVLYETRAITEYVDRKVRPTKLVPDDPRELARMHQWTNVADAYLVPHAGPLLLETLFRRYLGGERSEEAVAAARAGMQTALDAADAWLAQPEHFAGRAFSLADVHWMPYLEYLPHAGEADAVSKRRHLDAWWKKVSSRPTWQRVARSGPQPYDPGVTADAVAKHHGR